MRHPPALLAALAVALLIAAAPAAARGRGGPLALFSFAVAAFRGRPD